MSRPEFPTVSAICAAYDYGGFIERTLDSALQQDYPADKLEIVVVDDGSTDDTREVIAAVAARAPGRLRVVHQPNGGQVSATNRALAEATGDVLAILDADDLWPVDKIRRQVAVLQARPEVGLVYCDTEVIDRNDRIVHPSTFRLFDMEAVRGPGGLARLAGRPGNPAIASTIVVRRSLLETFWPVPTAVPYIDWWITGRTAAHAQVDLVEDLRIGYRSHGGNMTLGATGPAKVREQIKIAESRRQLLMRGIADHLSVDELLDAWRSFESDGLCAAQMAGSVYLPLPAVPAEEVAIADALADEACAAIVAGDWDDALRLAVRAVANDPARSRAREWLAELIAAVRRGREGLDEPLADTRSFLTLSFLPELLADPELLSAYAERFSAADDATLVVEAVGLAAPAALERLGLVLERAGLDETELPDVVIVIEKVPGLRLELERRAGAVLTRRRTRLSAPAFTPETADALRARYAHETGRTPVAV